MSWPALSQAALDFMPYTGVRYEHQSNLFEVSGPNEALEQHGDTHRADDVFVYLAGLDTRYQFGQQALSLSAEGRRLEYQQFDNIDHNEHKLAGIFDWKLGSAVDGLLQYRQERRVANFADIDVSDLTQQFERTVEGRVGVAVTPRWRLEGGARRYWMELPLPYAPEFEQQDTSAQVALKYTGFSHLSAGLLVQYTNGDYSGSADATSFDEVSTQLTAEYAIADFNSVNLRLGYTDRKLDRQFPLDQGGGGDDSVSGFTGALGYKRMFSVKTTASIEIFRRVDSFVAGTDALIDTGVMTALNWKATPKIEFGAQYSYVYSDFGSAGEDDNQGRRDRFHIGSVEVTYDFLRWLSLRPYARYRERDSTSGHDSFSNAIFGAELLAHFGGEERNR